MWLRRSLSVACVTAVCLAYTVISAAPALATLTAGLVAAGVDETTAFAIAITQRLCTHYLPPLWGYFSLDWLRRRGYV